jgi:glycosyltransferase involved in cell wall biosynthesis
VSGAPIRLAFVIDKLHRAGTQVHLGQLARGLDRSRVEVRVHCLLEGGPLADHLREGGIPVEEWRLGRLYSPQAFRGLLRLGRRLRADGTEVVHTYLPSANVFGGLAALHGKAPRLVTSRRDTGFSRNWRLGLVERHLVNPRVDRVVAVTAGIAAATERENGLAGKVVTIENGIDVRYWDQSAAPPGMRSALGLHADERAVAVVGHLSSVKGHGELLDAMARVAAEEPRVRLLVVGDGPLRGALEAQARRLGIGERVSFLGVRSDVRDVLSAVDVVALPSRTEGLSNALLEAMSMSRAVVATAVGGTPEVVTDRRNGRLVPPRSSPALARAILELVRDEPQALALGSEARRHVVERFGLDRMVARHEALYREILAR